MKRNWERATAILPLDQESLAKLIQPAFPSSLVERADPLSGGLSNTNYRLKIIGKDLPIRLRIFISRPECAQMETAVCRFVRSTVPAPNCIFESDSNVINGHPYALFEWIEGTMLNTVLEAATLEETANLARQTGEMLAVIGSFTFPSSGFLDRTLHVTRPLSMSSQAFQTYVEHDLYQRGAAELLGKELSAVLWSFVKAMSPMLDDLDKTPRLVHGDYDGTNIIARHGEGDSTLCGVIDWEYALSATPLVDIGHILRPPFGENPVFEHNLIDAFLGNGGLLPPNWRHISRLLDLLNWVGFPTRPAVGPNVLSSCRQMILKTMREW